MLLQMICHNMAMARKILQKSLGKIALRRYQRMLAHQLIIRLFQEYICLFCQTVGAQSQAVKIEYFFADTFDHLRKTERVKDKPRGMRGV